MELKCWFWFPCENQCASSGIAKIWSFFHETWPYVELSWDSTWLRYQVESKYNFVEFPWNWLHTISYEIDKYETLPFQCSANSRMLVNWQLLCGQKFTGWPHQVLAKQLFIVGFADAELRYGFIVLEYWPSSRLWIYANPGWEWIWKAAYQPNNYKRNLAGFKTWKLFREMVFHRALRFPFTFFDLQIFDVIFDVIWWFSTENFGFFPSIYCNF